MLTTDQKGNIAEHAVVYPVGGRTHIQLRLVPSKNNQQEGINWAKDFEFAATLSRPKGP